MQPSVAGYIILTKATGVPISDPIQFNRENMVNRTVKIGFYSNSESSFVYGTTLVMANWTDAEEDVWTFNDVGVVGTNPIVYKWTTKENIEQIDVIFEFAITVK